MEWVLSTIGSSLIGLLIGVIFQSPIKKSYRKIYKFIKRFFSYADFIPTHPTNLSIGNFKTAWTVIDGDGELEYTSENIRGLLNPKPIKLPDELLSTRVEIEKREEEKRMRGEKPQWNGPLYALEKYAIERSALNENIAITLSFQPTDYFNFQSTVMNLDKNLMTPPSNFTLRQKYLNNNNLDEPIPWLANGFGISLLVFTKDHKIILTRRPKDAGTRKSELDVSVVEGVHPERDKSTRFSGPDLYRTAKFGVIEELGIKNDDVDIKLLSFGVDVQYYQWNLIGVARTNLTSFDIQELRTRGINGKWEHKNLIIVNSDPKEIFNFIKNETIWSCGFATIYMALVHEFGKKKIDSLAKKVLSN